MVNTNYRADLRASALQSHRVEFAATGNIRCHNRDRPHRCHDYYQRHIAATATDNATSGTTTSGNASPSPLSVRRHRFRQHHDHYRQRFAATAIGNTSPPPFPATPRPIPATLRRHRFRQHHDHYRQRFAAIAIGNTSPPPLLATPRSLPATLRRHRYRQHVATIATGNTSSVAEVWYSFRPVRPVRV